MALRDFWGRFTFIKENRRHLPEQIEIPLSVETKPEPEARRLSINFDVHEDGQDCTVSMEVSPGASSPHAGALLYALTIGLLGSRILNALRALPDKEKADQIEKQWQSLLDQANLVNKETEESPLVSPMDVIPKGVKFENM